MKEVVKIDPYYLKKYDNFLREFLLEKIKLAHVKEGSFKDSYTYLLN